FSHDVFENAFWPLPVPSSLLPSPFLHLPSPCRCIALSPPTLSLTHCSRWAHARVVEAPELYRAWVHTKANPSPIIRHDVCLQLPAECCASANGGNALPR